MARVSGAGPIEISASEIGPEKAKAQNLTARHAWTHLRKNRCFYVADGVGAGKSFIALALAFGRWRVQRARNAGSGVFRVLIISPTNELSSGWMTKLTGTDAKTSRIGNLAIRPGENSFFDLYLREQRERSLDIVVYRLRGKHDAPHLERVTQEQFEFAPRQTSSNGRIEILVATPAWLTNGWRSGPGELGRKARQTWDRWLRGTDVIIADEVFGARNRWTNYGRLLRPNDPSPRVHFWSGRIERPWLIGLSATLLSRDITDAWSLFEIAYAWGDKSYDFDSPKTDPFEGLKSDLREFQASLMAGLSAETLNVRDASRRYREARMRLEEKLTSIIVRTPPERSRGYNFWSAGGASVHLGTTESQFPLKDSIHTVIDKCGDVLDDDGSAASNLALFLKTAVGRKNLFDPNTDRTVPATWSRVLELCTADHSPKHQSIRSWIEKYYDAAEKQWLNRKLADEFRFKILVYVHHVDTADAFKGDKRSPILGAYGKELQKMLRRRMQNTCWELARKNPKVFFGGSLNHPCQKIQEELEEQHADIETLKKPQYLTLLLAALVNMHKGTSQQDRVERFSASIRGHIEPVTREPFVRFLSRYPSVLRQILTPFGADSLVDFDADQRASKKKSPRLTVDALLIRSLDIPESTADEIIEKANALTASANKAIGVISGGKRLPRVAAAHAQALADFLTGAIQATPIWEEHIRSLARRPDGHLRRLTAQAKFENKHHRLPHEVAVLTGKESDTRDFVTQRFLTPGNPFLLVLTNICTVGVDLHRFCWDVLHFTPSWTPHELEQKTGRIDRPRIGLNGAFEIADPSAINRIRVHFLIWPNTYDERMLSRVHLRSQYSERLLSSKSQTVLEDKTSDGSESKFSLFDPLNLRPREE